MSGGSRRGTFFQKFNQVTDRMADDLEKPIDREERRLRAPAKADGAAGRPAGSWRLWARRVLAAVRRALRRRDR